MSCLAWDVYVHGLYWLLGQSLAVGEGIVFSNIFFAVLCRSFVSSGLTSRVRVFVTRSNSAVDCVVSGLKIFGSILRFRTFQFRSLLLSFERIKDQERVAI